MVKNKQKKVQLHVVYKTLTSDIMTYIGGKYKGWLKLFHVNGNPKRVGLAIFIFKQDILKSKTVTRT